MNHSLNHTPSLSSFLYGSIGGALAFVGCRRRRRRAGLVVPPVMNNWNPSSPPIAPEGFDDTLRKHGAVVVHFWANWDKSGRVMDARLQEVNPSVGDLLTFYSIDVDSEAHQKIVAHCRIMTTPTLMFFLDGNEYGRLVGLRTLPDVEALLQQWRGAVTVNGRG